MNSNDPKCMPGGHHAGIFSAGVGRSASTSRQCRAIRGGYQSSAAVVSGAKICIKNVATARSTEVQTDSKDTFNVSNWPQESMKFPYQHRDTAPKRRTRRLPQRLRQRRIFFCHSLSARGPSLRSQI